MFISREELSSYIYISYLYDLFSCYIIMINLLMMSVRMIQRKKKKKKIEKSLNKEVL